MTRDEFLMEVSAMLAEHLPDADTLRTVRLAVAITDHAERHACCFVHALPVARAKIKAAAAERVEWFAMIEKANADDADRDKFKAHVVVMIEFELRANRQTFDPASLDGMAEQVIGYCIAMGLPLIPESVQTMTFDGRGPNNLTKH